MVLVSFDIFFKLFEFATVLHVCRNPPPQKKKKNTWKMRVEQK